MKSALLSPSILLTAAFLAVPAQAENFEHVQRLVTTRECPGCELNGAGFVYGNLEGANLRGADLSQANFNRANLSGADLSGANLTGAVFYNANLSGANLSGADLRESFLSGVNWEGANLNGVSLLGAVGLPTTITTPENLYQWGLMESQRGNFRGSIQYYDQALQLDPTFAHARFARGMARLRLNDIAGATEDAKQARELYIAQQNEEGREATTQFVEGIEAAQVAREREQRGGGRGNILGVLGSLSGLVLRFLLPF